MSQRRERMGMPRPEVPEGPHADHSQSTMLPHWEQYVKLIRVRGSITSRRDASRSKRKTDQLSFSLAGTRARRGPSTMYLLLMASSAAAIFNDAYASHVNPQWVKLLNLLQMNVRYESCSGVELKASDGRTILDFLSGYCVHNAGHNHPEIIEALKDELDRKGPAMLQSHIPELAGELSARLCSRAGGKLTKTFFCS